MFYLTYKFHILLYYQLKSAESIFEWNFPAIYKQTYLLYHCDQTPLPRQLIKNSTFNLRVYGSRWLKSITNHGKEHGQADFQGTGRALSLHLGT